MTDSPSPAVPVTPADSSLTTTLKILPPVSFTFICYLTIGIPLAVLSTYAHLRLGYGTVLAGLVISAQYVATVISRPRAAHRQSHLLERRRHLRRALRRRSLRCLSSPTLGARLRRPAHRRSRHRQRRVCGACSAHPGFRAAPSALRSRFLESRPARHRLGLRWHGLRRSRHLYYSFFRPAPLVWRRFHAFHLRCRLHLHAPDLLRSHSPSRRLPCRHRLSLHRNLWSALARFRARPLGGLRCRRTHRLRFLSRLSRARRGSCPPPPRRKSWHRPRHLQSLHRPLSFLRRPSRRRHHQPRRLPRLLSKLRRRRLLRLSPHPFPRLPLPQAFTLGLLGSGSM